MCYKILHSHTCLNPDDFSHGLPLISQEVMSLNSLNHGFYVVVMKFLFPVRVINFWNSLPD